MTCFLLGLIGAAAVWLAIAAVIIGWFNIAARGPTRSTGPGEAET